MERIIGIYNMLNYYHFLKIVIYVWNQSKIYLFQVKLADPDIVSNPSEYQKLAQSVSDLDVVLYLTLNLCLHNYSVA